MHLPWDRQSLEDLLRKVIPTGETSKVDLKRDFELSDVPHQAELLKDISAIANTYNQHYRNHGFVVFGVEQTSLVGCTLRWARLSEQIFRVDKWSVCRG
jgi:predicted HTH transcriptional regulator